MYIVTYVHTVRYFRQLISVSPQLGKRKPQKKMEKWNKNNNKAKSKAAKPSKNKYRKENIKN